MIRARSWRDTSAAWTTDGAPSAPRPIMTGAQPVALVMAHASSAVRPSPLPTTGIATASTTRAMISQGATPLNCCERVRGWTMIASTPSPSAIRAISTAFTVRSSQPPRILIVRSTPIAFRRVRKTTAAPSGSRISAAPWPLATIFATGQPMLRSTASAPAASRCRAASARTSGSAPRSCIAIGCSSGRNRASADVRTLPTTSARASISSLVSRPAPHSRATSLNGTLVTAAIGARRRSITSPASQIRPRAAGRSLHHRDGADRTAVRAFELERQGDEPAARSADLVEVGQVLDHRDAGREEDRVRRVLLPGRAPARLGDGVADAMVRRIVVADGPGLPGDEPLAGARPRPRPLFPERLGLDAHPLRPARPQQHDVAGAHVLGAGLEVLRGHLAVGAEMGEIDHGRFAHPLVDGHRGHVATVDQVVERRVDMRVGVTADREHRALQGMPRGVRGRELRRDLQAEVRPDGKAQIDDPHRRHLSATSTATGNP